MKRKPRNPVSKLKQAEQRLKLAEISVRLDRLKLAKKATKAALSTYAGASRNRTNRDWKSPNVSADAAIVPDAPVLNARARQMVNDNSYAKSAVRAFKRNIVGTGINPTFAAMDANGNTLDVFNKMAGVEWWDWSTRPDLCDIEGVRSFVDIQRWAVTEIITVGEAFVIWRYDYARHDNTGDCGLVLQCVESEQLDTTLTQCNGNEVRGGIEANQFGKAIAYHFYTRHPNDLAHSIGGKWNSDIRINEDWDTREPHEKGTQHSYLAQSVRVPAAHVMHVYDPDRARQSRGVSRFHSVLQRLRDLDQFEYAELLKARAQACIGFAIESDPGQWGNDGLSITDTGEGNPRTDTDGNDEFASQPLMVARLAKGEKINAFTPTSPSGQFSPFVMQNARAIAAGLGLSYEQLVRDFTNGSFSSQRQSLLEDRREFQMFISDICNKLCQPVARQFIQWAMLEGRIPTVKAPMSALAYIKWRGQGWQWVDPEKEVNAHEKALSLGLETKEGILGEKGEDWREVAEQRTNETKYETSLSDSGVESVEETFNGDQVTSAVEVLIGVSAGTISPSTATEMLVQFFKLDPATATRMVKAQSTVSAVPSDAVAIDAKTGAAV